MIRPEKKGKIFLSYAREDVERAKEIYSSLNLLGFDVWFDKKSLLPGQNWDAEIRKTIKESNYFIALLSSNSVSKDGYVQNELKQALDLVDELPLSEIFVIPIRIEECEPKHDRLYKLHWIDLFQSYKDGMMELLRVLSPEFRITVDDKLIKYFQDEKNSLKEIYENTRSDVARLIRNIFIIFIVCILAVVLVIFAFSRDWIKIVVYPETIKSDILKNASADNDSLYKNLKDGYVSFKVINHTISQGERLFDLEKIYGTNWKVIQRVNEIEDPNQLKPGTIIRIPVKKEILEEFEINNQIK